MMAFTIKQKPLTVPPLNSVVEGVKCLFTAILHTYWLSMKFDKST